MRILLDECVPLQVRLALADHDVTTAQRMGWGGIFNGDLLDKAEQQGVTFAYQIRRATKPKPA